ncbi:MAG: hypothetical protein AAF847_04330 [Bacteroidota bacterium]
MDTPLYVFEADASKEWLQLSIAMVSTVLMIAAFLWLKSREVAFEKRNLQRTGQMLLGFGLIISIGSIFGVSWRLTQLGDVEVYKDRLVSSYGTVPYQDLKVVFLHTGYENSLISQTTKLDTTLLAYFEEKIGRSYVFSEEHYDVEQMVFSVRPILDSLQAK